VLLLLLLLLLRPSTTAHGPKPPPATNHQCVKIFRRNDIFLQETKHTQQAAAEVVRERETAAS
jgi:hypothetical protein